ncbi:uncharacterized protein LOC121932806 isoform X2 [Sceloporus undulatus]|uniref:uncharacterized protein LOC121932806 isoform X2 n=1 Tax=Sceloporus undulatus TaxID=8520 RepID=UPI001C4B5AE6|nr:uncharacterized protein LOC121932806 isoform X2 [Sceloporus undulatus]
MSLPCHLIWLSWLCVVLFAKYVRVMPYGGQCYEDGPFFPTTPRHVVQVGIAPIPDLILKPDWQAIVGIIVGLVFLLLICLLVVFLCQVFGWSRKQCLNPRFRQLQMKYNLDKYSSKESKFDALRKYHPGIQKSANTDNNCSRIEQREGGYEIWDSEEQIDLDSFNTNVFFEILVTQSLAVTAKLSQFKEELKHLYHKLLEETASLRDLWIAKVGIPDGVESSSDELVRNYTKAKQQAEAEIQRRRHLATEYEECVSRQLRLLTGELKSHEEHWVAFHSALREATRLAELLADTLSSGEESKSNHHRLLNLIDAASNQMSSLIVKESHRLMLWGILREGTGGQLVNKEKTRLLTKEELVGPDGSVKAHDALHQVATTGLIVPRDDAVMLLANQSMKLIPPDHFLHPGTGKVLPVAGNIGFSPINSKLIPMVDLASDELPHTARPIFPYIPYPMCPNTGLPIKSKLPILQPEKVFKLGGFMHDPASGIEVPILAVTIHPQTGQKMTLGGTYLNPLTGMVTPLEIGGPMRATEGGKIVPILGVSVDSNTGDVIPLGGLQGSSENLLLIGDSFVEALSGKIARVQGLCLQQGKVAPHAGGYKVVLEANLLIAQIRVAKALREYKDDIWEDRCSAGDGQTSLKVAEEDMTKVLSQKLDYLTYWLQNLEKQQECASHLKSTGGKLGMIKYPGTELWMPAVFGMKIPDPGGSGLMVPILGVECDWKTGQPIPLAGTMDNANGEGLVPLAIGFRTIDPITGEMGPVIGAQVNPWTMAVIPVVQSLGSLPRGSPDPDLIKYQDKLKPADEICRFLKESSVQEAQRGANRHLKTFWDSQESLYIRVEKDERDQEAKVRFLLRKMLERLVQFIRKVQLEEGRIQMQLKEVERQRSSSLQTLETVQEKSRKTSLHLVAVFEDHITKQRANIERAYCRLEYLRYLLDTVALQTKDLHSGSSQCFVNYPGLRFYGAAAGAAQGSWEVINHKLIPLLKSVLEALKENKRSHLSPKMLLGLGSEKGYSSRSTLKVSEADAEAFRTKTRQGAAPIVASLLPGGPLSQPTPKRSQLLQEIQTRILLEKHASEMLHLELSLLAEEIHMISCFWESSRLKKNLGTGPDQDLEVASEWDNLLKELAGFHWRSEEELSQQHWEETKHAGLSPEEVTLEDGTLFSLEETLQNLALLCADLQKADSSLGAEAAKENSETHILKGKLSPAGSVALKMQAMAVKIVKQETLKQILKHRVLDHYSKLQRRTFPEEISQALGHLHTGENVVQDVIQSVQKQQVERAVTFLQKEKEDLSTSFNEKDEAQLQKLQALIRMELQMQIEEKLEAKETEAIREAAKQNRNLPADCLVYFLLSGRHLRQAALLLEASLGLQEAAIKAQGDGSAMEESALDGSMLDENTKAIIHLLKEKKEYTCSMLELQQASQMLQLREKQFQETVQKLKAYSSDQRLENADQIAIELQQFRQEKTKELEDQLRTFLSSPKTQEGPSDNPNSRQSEKPLLEKEETEGKGKEKWEKFQEAWLIELEETYRGQISEEKAKLQDQLERGEFKKWSKQKLLREHDETMAFLDKAFRQEMHKRRERMEKGRKRKHSHQQERSLPASDIGSMQGQHQSNLAEEDKVFSLLAEYVKILKQTELLVMLRIFVLNPRFKPLLSGGNEADGNPPSQILTLLNEVNCQFQKCASALGLLDNQYPEYDTASSFQDIMDIQMSPKSGELVPLLASSLSAREFVVYQYGIVILQFLRPLIGGPEIDLCLASSIPSSNAPGNAFRNTFYYQCSGHKLFVLRECLSCVGSFLLLLVHCLAHITADELSHDSNPAFRRLFHQALKACLGELFSLRLQASAFLEDSKSAARMINEAFLKKEVVAEEKINPFFLSLSDVKVKPSTDLEEKCLPPSSGEKGTHLAEQSS